MKFLLIFLLSFMTILSSCTPQTNARRGAVVGSTDGAENEDETDSSNDGDISTASSWIVGGQTLTSAIFNANDSASFYLQGTGIENIAESSDNSLVCLVVNFIDANNSFEKQLRLRAARVKLISTNQYIYRVLPSTSSDNQAACGGNAPLINTSGTSLKVISTTAAYTLSEVCPSCSRTIVSTSIQLYQTTNGIIGTELTANTAILSGLNIRIDPNNAVSDNNGTCTNFSCQTSGFDCCIEGQCVDDGSLRSNPDANQLTQALIDVASNPQNFKNWPNVYYVCSEDNGDPIDPDDGNEDPDPTDPNDEARIQLEKDILKYRCLNEDVSFCDPDFNTVRTNVWRECGCLLDPITNDPLDPRCPDYNLRKIEDQGGNIIKIECDIPDDNPTPAPFQDVDISVSARTAPHRFFDTNGVTYDGLDKVPAGTNQEGEEFSYTNQAAALGPNDTSFEMNTVLGMFALDQAQPATTIDIDLDTVYVIRANSGVYSPCVSCTQDPWFNAFSSHPTVNSPYGLYSVNYSTSRDNFLSNETRGNYEDTIFGRACWVPPTMLPFSHKPDGDVNVQRRNRLKTQAAMWINGYQRDWYGFNKGALIASFDGVSWFAVGSGRRVKSTTKKLFIAINAPFADLAEPTSYNVSVMEDNGIQNAAVHDYDFDLDPQAVNQNPGASCQLNHTCDVDSDCVAKLGWEYKCADVTRARSFWPRFDLNADENVNTASEFRFNNIITGGLSGSSNKRCVYRGAGSVCKRNYSTLSTDNDKKLMACAPNFSCQSLRSSSFNERPVRTPNDPSNDLYGQSANILGRMEIYFGADENLDSEIRSNISYNATLNYGTNPNDSTEVLANEFEYGLCVPGKDASNNTYITQHSSTNLTGVDHISQIGTCNPDEATTAARLAACPTFDGDGNIYLETDDNDLKLRQNACGVEFDSGGSSFLDNILTVLKDNDTAEDGTGVATTISEKGFARNACFRRAGSSCHTDYDCAPNSLHEEYALNNTFGTKAEQDFWSESLVCRQRDDAPIRGVASVDDYYNFDMGKNKCCREITNDFTMYTAYTGTQATELPDYDADNSNLDATKNPATNPGDADAYSRYIVSTTKEPMLVDTAQGFIVGATATQLDKQTNMWKTLNETGSANCCGGGFIRKFSDGTHDWTRSNRFNVDPSNFQCLNYTNTLYKETPYSNIEASWIRDYTSLCFYPRVGSGSVSGINRFGCSQSSFIESTNFDNTSPLAPTYETSGAPAAPYDRIELEYAPEDTDTGNGSIDLSTVITDGAIYYPLAYTEGSGTTGSTADYANELYRFRDYDNFTNESQPNDSGYINSMKMGFLLPIFFDPTQDPGIKVTFRGDSISGTGVYEKSNIGAPSGACKATINAFEATPADNTFTERVDLDGDGPDTSEDPRVAACYYLDGSLERYILLIAVETDGNNSDEDVTDWKYAWPSIMFNTIDTNTNMNVGESLYYLKKFENYELLGIPQITYEPLYCNDVITGTTPIASSDDQELVPGIYKNSIRTRADYQDGTIGNSYNGTAIDEGYFREDKFAVEQIFAAHEFKCCAKLGTEVDSAARCCSNFSEEINGDNKQRCALPTGTNLMVYFNKYVSSESAIEEYDTGALDEDLALLDSEFEPNGFPKQDASVRGKLEEIGRKFCESQGTREGVAFANYIPEPNRNGTFQQDPGEAFREFYSIIDSPNDIASVNGSFDGSYYNAFTTQNFKWNHHIYCQ